MKRIIFIVLFFISRGNCFGQQVTFQKTFGGTVTTLCTTVGISPTPAFPGGEGVTIAPNPSSGNFVITFPNTINKGSIEIYTVLEKVI